MIKELFVDTVFWIALINPRDSLHVAALSLLEKYSETSLVTTQEVLIEVLNYFSWRGPALRQATIVLIEQLYEQPNVIVWE